MASYFPWEGGWFLFKHVLSSIPIHLLTVLQPPKGVIQDIGRLLTSYGVHLNLEENIIWLHGKFYVYWLRREGLVSDHCLIL